MIVQNQNATSSIFYYDCAARQKHLNVVFAHPLRQHSAIRKKLENMHGVAIFNELNQIWLLLNCLDKNDLSWPMVVISNHWRAVIHLEIIHLEVFVNTIHLPILTKVYKNQLSRFRKTHVITSVRLPIIGPSQQLEKNKYNCQA